MYASPQEAAAEMERKVSVALDSPMPGIRSIMPVCRKFGIDRRTLHRHQDAKVKTLVLANWDGVGLYCHSILKIN